MTSNLVFDVPKGNVSIVDFLGYMNHLTDFGSGGILGVVMLIVVASIIFYMSRGNGNERALSLAFLFVGILSIFVRILGLINDSIMAIFIVCGFVGLWLLIKEDDKYEV